MTCCSGMTRAFLIIFNIIFWLTGAAILGVGIWFLVDKNINNYLTIVQVDTDDVYYKYAAYILIGFGGFVFLVGFCGCCGAIRGSKCLIGFYIFFLLLIIGGEIAAAVLMILYMTEVKDKLDTILQESVEEKYGNSTTVKDAWDYIQIKLECCGYNGASDYSKSSYMEAKNMAVPISCCILTNRDEALDSLKSATAKNETACEMNVDMYYQKSGCKVALEEKAVMYSSVIIGVALGIAFLEIFGLICAACFCRTINNDDEK